MTQGILARRHQASGKRNENEQADRKRLHFWGAETYREFTKQFMTMPHLEGLMKPIVVSAYRDHHDLARNKNTQGATWDTQFTMC